MQLQRATVEIEPLRLPMQLKTPEPFGHAESNNQKLVNISEKKTPYKRQQDDLDIGAFLPLSIPSPMYVNVEYSPSLRTKNIQTIAELKSNLHPKIGGS